ncbi:hypothetical protein JKP75_07935 [Blastococcus sp. TML/M2B]|uniref:hypothetical protein n=1 Tax=unclassified Blastococcus TaxID=2619396 RepID=UPI00190B4FA2|nr:MULTISPECIES: hypothetical protein [unclassified Blastococcus]MBN1092498.1 hypothetical protein [Blastococcus sp. TML/M2B]MBN1097409.1 hypothetical protein [Blastococcus sp. TML/C7B]
MGAQAWVWAVLAVVAVLLLLWTAWTLVRLTRLEARVARARATLEVQLRRRAGLAEELAREHAAALGPERARALAGAAADARSSGPGDREAAENALGRELRELPPELPGVPAPLQADLAGTSTRVALARRFYNDAVRDTQALRSRRLPRVLRLHAGSPLPRFFDIDDRLEVLTGSGAGHAAAERP